MTPPAGASVTRIIRVHTKRLSQNGMRETSKQDADRALPPSLPSTIRNGKAGADAPDGDRFGFAIKANDPREISHLHSRLPWTLKPAPCCAAGDREPGLARTQAA